MPTFAFAYDIRSLPCKFVKHETRHYRERLPLWFRLAGFSGVKVFKRSWMTIEFNGMACEGMV